MTCRLTEFEFQPQQFSEQFLSVGRFESPNMISVMLPRHAAAPILPA